MSAPSHWPQRYGALTFAAILTAFSASCGVAELSDPVLAGPDRELNLVLQQQSYTLPTELVGDASLTISVLGDGVYLGAKAGLYTLDASNAFEQLDAAPVIGLARHFGDEGEQSLVIARPRGLQLLARGLQDAPINLNALGTLRALAESGSGTLWIAGETMLRWHKLAMEQLAGLGPVQTIEVFSPEQLVLREEGGALVALERRGSDWTTHRFSAEQPEITALSPFGSRWGYLALVGGKLALRDLDNTGLPRWAPYRLEGGPTQPQVGRLVPDASSQRVWALGSSTLYRLDGARAELGRFRLRETLDPKARAATTADGSLWVVDGLTLRRWRVPARSNTTPPSYAKTITPFLGKHCARCHGASGPGRPLDSYEAVRSATAAIISALRSEQMPPDRPEHLADEGERFTEWQQASFPQ